MRSTGFTHREVRQAIKSYMAEIDEIVAMIPSGTYLRGAAGDDAKSTLSRLKQQIKTDYERRKTAAGAAAMSDVERRFFFPAVHRTFCELQQVRVNTQPGPKWLSALHSAHSELSYWLYGLKKEATEPE